MTMLKTRIIPTMLYKDYGLVKGVGFDSRRSVGDALQAIKVYNLRCVDELILVDVTATLDDRPPDFELIDDLADDCFMPLTVGGGVRTIDDVGALLAVGADKVSIGTAAIADPALVENTAARYGSQCVVVSIDTKFDEDGRNIVHTHAGSRPTTHNPVEIAQRMERSGAGEILLTSVDRDGTMDGYDLDTIKVVAQAVSIPVIASGGAGMYQHMADAVIEAGASAVAAASIFHFTQLTPMGAKRHLGGLGIPVRR